MQQDMEAWSNIENLLSTTSTTELSPAVFQEAMPLSVDERDAVIAPDFLTYPLLQTATTSSSFCYQNILDTGDENILIPNDGLWISSAIPLPVNDHQLFATLARHPILEPFQPEATKTNSSSNVNATSTLPNSKKGNQVCAERTQEPASQHRKRKRRSLDIRPLPTANQIYKKRLVQGRSPVHPSTQDTGARSCDSKSDDAARGHEGDEITTIAVRPSSRDYGSTINKAEGPLESQNKTDFEDSKSLVEEMGRSGVQCCSPETTHDFRIQWCVSPIPVR
ncbi:hypothetical protein FMEXI_12262 [Fusarium mexicanum]|uniref:Uncharacterized protein n=1 Tax=Fusarium mexicanum TaxID=751941 RepID=A0A8H5MKS1_9HYPO|nr:hypothetical protein FMEXI_12262 [Fusarium mexicanum]